MVARLGPTVAAADWLLGIAVLQELDHDVVELHEAHVEALIATLEIRHANGSRIDSALPRNDLLIGHQRVVDPLAVKIAVAHHLVAAEHFGVELEGAIHVLDRHAKVLHSLEPRAERRVVAPLVALLGREPPTSWANAGELIARAAAIPPIAAPPAARSSCRRSGLVPQRSLGSSALPVV